MYSWLAFRRYPCLFCSSHADMSRFVVILHQFFSFIIVMGMKARHTYEWWIYTHFLQVACMSFEHFNVFFPFKLICSFPNLPGIKERIEIGSGYCSHTETSEVVTSDGNPQELDCFFFNFWWWGNLYPQVCLFYYPFGFVILPVLHGGNSDYVF